MLARSGPLPREDGYAFELKWDGFRAITRCGSGFQVRSRRGWNMTHLLPELAALPVEAVLDGCVIDHGAAKAALLNVAKALSQELGPKGIRINSISPGPVATDL
jgi:NAD(P)-dependent dehydrogenase (short-subunit alcohol dehydrogenase family)